MALNDIRLQGDMWVPEPLLLGDESGGAEAKRGCRFARNAGDLKRRVFAKLLEQETGGSGPLPHGCHGEVLPCVKENSSKFFRRLTQGCRLKGEQCS